MTRANQAHPPANWACGVWFSYATPKYAFITWLALLDRLSTMDRVKKWSPSVDDICVLCKNAGETRSHLFFECTYSSHIWDHIVRGVMGTNYTMVWNEIVSLLGRNDRDKKRLFCFRYAFQAVIHTIWRERNRIKHGEKPLPIAIVLKLIDKGVRNKLSLLRRKGVKGMEGALQFWFSTRI